MKLEVGKKYWTRDRENWGQIIFDRRTLNKCADGVLLLPFIVIYSDGVVDSVTLEGNTTPMDVQRNLTIDVGRDLMEEYHEPIKHSVEGWICYNDEETDADNYYPLDVITGLSTDQIIYPKNDKPDSTMLYPHVTYRRFTCEEWPEPKD